jgi:DNA-binding transcriptional LysR family regulator
LGEAKNREQEHAAHSEGDNMYNITFQQIEVFLNVARHQNISKAADSMYITQPALSKTLQRFEEGIGIKLFRRNNQGVALTSEGEYLYSTLEPLYTNINKTISMAKSIALKPPKTLRIIEPSTYDAAEDFDEVKRYVRLFEEKYKDIVLVESLGDFQELRRSLAYGENHLTVMQDFALARMQGISYKRISKFYLYLAMSYDHPLAAYDKIIPEALSKEVFYRVAVLDEMEDREMTLKRSRRHGFEPKHIEFVPNFATLFHKIKTKKGLSICGKFAYVDKANEVKYIPLEMAEDSSYVVIAWRTGFLSREAEGLVALIPGETIET